MKNVTKLYLAVCTLCVFFGLLGMISASTKVVAKNKISPAKLQTSPKPAPGTSPKAGANAGAEVKKTPKGSVAASSLQNNDRSSSNSRNSSTSGTDGEASTATTPLAGNADSSPAKNASASKTEKSTDSFLGSIGELLFWLLLVLAGLAVIAGLGYFIYRFLNKVKHEREEIARTFKRVDKTHMKYDERFTKLEAKIKQLIDELNKQHRTLKSLQGRPGANAGDVIPAEISPEPLVYKPEPQFPAAAEDFLNKVRGFAQPARADLIGGRLIQDANDSNEFFIVNDPSLSDGLFYAVPGVDRFSNKNDYFTYYQNYYRCDNPSSGMVWIKSPATVTLEEGGWRLHEKGEMETR